MKEPKRKSNALFNWGLVVSITVIFMYVPLFADGRHEAGDVVWAIIFSTIAALLFLAHWMKK